MNDQLDMRTPAFALKLMEFCDDAALCYNVGRRVEAWQAVRDALDYFHRNVPLPSPGAVAEAAKDDLDAVVLDQVKITGTRVLKAVVDAANQQVLHEHLVAALAKQI